MNFVLDTLFLQCYIHSPEAREKMLNLTTTTMNTNMKFNKSCDITKDPEMCKHISKILKTRILQNLITNSWSDNSAKNLERIHRDLRLLEDPEFVKSYVAAEMMVDILLSCHDLSEPEVDYMETSKLKFPILDEGFRQILSQQ